MKFKIKKGSELFEKLEGFLEEGKSANKAASDLLDTFEGKTGTYIPNTSLIDLYGGILAVEFECNPGKGWMPFMKNEEKYNGFYKPDKRTKIGKEIQKKIDSLPLVKSFKLNNILNTPEVDYRIYHPGFQKLDDCFIVSFPSYVTYDNYTPLEGMEEITEKEYMEIKNKETIKH